MMMSVRRRVISLGSWWSTAPPPASFSTSSPELGSAREPGSLGREAAALVEARGGTTATCQVNDIHAAPCPKRAEVKLADPAGDTVWACLTHADEIPVTVPGSFIASQDEPGIGWFLSRRRG
jgi:hypothetical protein